MHTYTNILTRSSTRRPSVESMCDKHVTEASFYRWKTEVKTKPLTLSGYNYLEGQGISFLNFCLVPSQSDHPPVESA